MDLGVVLSEVTTFAETTLGGFGPIIAVFVGLFMALEVVDMFRGGDGDDMAPGYAADYYHHRPGD